MSSSTVLRVLVIVIALIAASGATRVQRLSSTEDLGISGYVLAPDGTPVTGGSVVMQSSSARTATTIEPNGRFRIVPDSPGLHQLLISVSDLAPYRVEVSAPPSRTLRLPVIRLSPATYFRARFVSSVGEPIRAPQLRLQSLDVSGLPISPMARVSHEIDGEGVVTIGPLPRGVTTLALDTPPLAQTRLPDLLVTGAETLLDGGVITVQPGAVLHVDVIGTTGTVAAHDVFLEEALPLSPLGERRVRTNQQGRASFDRLGPGRYRVRTRALGRCDNQFLTIARLGAVSGSGTLLTRVVVSGTAKFRVTSPLGPLGAIRLSASPDSSPIAAPEWVREASEFSRFVRRPLGAFAIASACGGSTDADGRVTLSNFPPGPARVDVHLLNSTSVRRVSVPEEGQEVPIVIPDGFLPVRVTDAVGNQPVAGAAVTWTGGGVRVEAATSAIGESLLEGVGTTAGTLSITARGYQRTEAKLSEPPGTLYEVALVPASVTNLQLRVVTTSGEPLPNAIVELFPANAIEVAHIAVTDAKGFVNFSDAPPGVLRLMASADGFVPAVIQISQESRGEVVLTLARGYRIVANVEANAKAGPHLVRVVNEVGASMDGVLDFASDRKVDPPGRVSLGPLPPGNYAIELLGTQQQWRERVRIVDRDVNVTFR